MAKPIKDVIVLAPQNDPFYSGTKTNRLMAEWFSKVWQEAGYTSGVHLRRIHYRLVSKGDAKKHDGETYQNTENHWAYLNNAAKQARYLGLVNPLAFEDRRNPEAVILTNYQDVYSTEPTFNLDFSSWDLRSYDFADIDDPSFDISGYKYSDRLQPYHIELWIEKSTMNDILLPICKEYKLNLVHGIGFLSITRIIELLLRINEIGKPTRIFYISDFDPAGDFMPVSVARQLEYWINDYCPNGQVKLNPLVLTKAQARQYKLPRTPIKESDKRKNSFEERRGTGAVELDALEALHPGVLKNIIVEAVEPFHDFSIESDLEDAQDDAEDLISTAIADSLNPHREELDKIQTEVKKICRDFNQKINPYREKLINLQDKITESVYNSFPGLPDRPEPEEKTDSEEWLFDSEREYFEQIEKYREYKK